MLASSRELPFLPAIDHQAPDLTLDLERTPVPHRNAVTRWYERASDGEDGGSLVIDRSAAGDLFLRFTDGTEFQISAGGRNIGLIAAPEQYTTGDLAAYALGPVLAVALHLQGAALLHASAVVLRNRAVLFAGDSGSGKSTIAALLQREGYTVLSDDVTEVSETLTVAAAMPAIRLWPDAVRALFGDDAAFPDRAPSWDKKVVTVPSPGEERYAVAAVLLLDRHGDVGALTRVTPAVAWRELIAHAYTGRLPDPPMIARIFDLTTHIATQVPVYRFHPPSMAAAHDSGALLESALAEHLR